MYCAFMQAYCVQRCNVCCVLPVQVDMSLGAVTPLRAVRQLVPWHRQYKVLLARALKEQIRWVGWEDREWVQGRAWSQELSCSFKKRSQELSCDLFLKEQGHLAGQLGAPSGVAWECWWHC